MFVEIEGIIYNTRNVHKVRSLLESDPHDKELTDEGYKSLMYLNWQEQVYTNIDIYSLQVLLNGGQP